jgi:hypothetical protein
MRTQVRAFVASLIVALSLGAQQSARRAPNPLASGRVANPLASPVLPDIVAFERIEGEHQELLFLRAYSQEVFSLKTPPGRRNEQVNMQNVVSGGDAPRLTSYAGQLDWRPVDEQGRSWFAYVASDSASRLGLMLNYVDRVGLARTPPLHVPFPGGKPSFPRWSPDGKHLAFVSDSSILHIVSDVDVALRAMDANNLRPTRIATASRPASYPEWSPFGDHIAYGIETVSRGNRNGAIEVLPLIKLTGKVAGSPVIVTEELIGDNEYRPTWSPDAKYIAFYADQGGLGGKQSQTSIGIVEIVVGARDQLVRRGSVIQRSQRWIADDVIPNQLRGPAWTSVTDGAQPRPALLYVQRNDAHNNPIVAASVQRWVDGAQAGQYAIEMPWGTVKHKTVSSVQTYLNMRSVYVSVVGGGDAIQVHDDHADWAKGPEPVGAIGVQAPVPTGKQPAGQTGKQPKAVDDPGGTVVIYAHKGKDVGNAVLFPGLGQLSAGQKTKGRVLASIGLAGIAYIGLGVAGTHSAASKGEKSISAGDIDQFLRDSTSNQNARTKVMRGALVYGAAWLYGILDAAIGRPPRASRFSFGLAPSGTEHRGQASGQIGFTVPFGGAHR